MYTLDFPNDDYVVYELEQPNNFVAVEKEEYDENIFPKISKYSQISLIPEEYEVEVIPLSLPDDENKIHLQPDKIYKIQICKLKGVFHPLI
jgi:hypothetical protein